MSEPGPAVDLARGDRVAGYRVTSVLGHGREGVAATVTDEFLDLQRILKAYPAEPQWVERLRFVAQAFAELAELGVCPRPLHGGVAVSSRSAPMAFLVVEHRLGKPLDQLLNDRRWTAARARRLVADIAQAVARVHASGMSLGDFEAGNNIVLVEGRPLFIDIGLTDDDDPGPHYADDFECLASIARQLGERTGDDELTQVAASLDARCTRRLDRRSFAVWLKHSSLAG